MILRYGKVEINPRQVSQKGKEAFLKEFKGKIQTKDINEVWKEIVKHKPRKKKASK